jgi:nucleotide-binding universal stress UspA family protein
VKKETIGGQPRGILLATDLSARCDRALDRAAALAIEWQARLVAVHALEGLDSFYTADLDFGPRRPSDALIVAERQLRRDLPSAVPELKAVVEEGRPIDVVLRAAADTECGLIVTGLARDETLGRFGLGTTVDQLLRRSRIPVLVVKRRVRAPYRRIVVATDFSESSRHALSAALAFFPGADFTVVHAYDAHLSGVVNDPERHHRECRAAATREYEAFMAGSPLGEERRGRIELYLGEGPPNRLIHRYAREREVDLIALGTHGRSALFNLLIGGTAKEILSSLSCDALVVRDPRAG